MKNFLSAPSPAEIRQLVENALQYKKNPLVNSTLGTGKTLGLIFMNSSLRTRLSTQKAAANLGMQVMVMNINQDGWALEFNDGVMMNGSSVEHIREAAGVLSQYVDILGVRCFPGLQDKEADYNEHILEAFKRHCTVPIISLESGTLHPLQSLADLITIEELRTGKKPKVVLTWAPHIKPLPQAVPNSFAQWMNLADVDFWIAHPEGYELAPEFAGSATITHNQDEALRDADFIYVKNWSSYTDYGQVLHQGEGWMLTPERLQISNAAKVMHCLPVRRDLELSSAILDGPQSVVLQQAANRVFAAQAVLKSMLS